MIADARPRSFVPTTLNAGDFAEIEPLYLQLLDRPLETQAQAERWLVDFSELTSVLNDSGNRLYINKSCHTDDPEIEKAYLRFVEEIEPKIKPLHFQLQRKLLESPAAGQLKGQRYALLLRHWRAEVELFREQNVAIETQVTLLNKEYDKIYGAMMVDFRGKQYTTDQAYRFVEDPDRPTRQEAWEAVSRRRLLDREAIESIFDQQLHLRQTIARNAGLSDYRAFSWKAFKRFDYTPQDCLSFADAVEQTCVPILRELDQKRRQDLGLDRLRPWDFAVDPKSRPPLRPFEESNVDGLIDGVKAIVSRLSPQLAEEFESLRTHNNLDLQTRKGKQPGGYICPFQEPRQAFIFMNAAGVQDDLFTLLHEGGHAFHFLAAWDEPLVFLRVAPVEFLEVASISMEMLGSDHFDVFYSAAETSRARRAQMERVIGLLTSCAKIDSFQHWIYTHPRHGRDQRTAEWLRLGSRFSSDVDWSGHEDAQATGWMRVPHLFHQPFYYIEYGIAQLGALQLWLKSRQDPHGALAGYRAALALGGTRTLPELFAAAGIVFDFSAKTLGPLMQAVQEELDGLPS